MKAKDESGLRFWAIEYARSPSPGGTQGSGLLCMPLPWEEGGTVRAAVMVYESRPLAEAGLDHYLAWTGRRTPPTPCWSSRPRSWQRYWRGVRGLRPGGHEPDSLAALPRGGGLLCRSEDRGVRGELKSLSLWLGTLLVKMTVGASMGKFLSALGESAPLWV